MSHPFAQRHQLGQSGVAPSMSDLAAEPLARFARAEPSHLNLGDTATWPHDRRVQTCYRFVGGEGNQDGSPLTEDFDEIDLESQWVPWLFLGSSMRSGITSS